MKDIEIHEEIRRNPALSSAIERATKLLAEEIGPSAGSVSVEWTISKGGPTGSLILLKISDWTGSAMVAFQPSALEQMSESALRIPLVRVWGDLLQDRSHKQMEALNRAVQSLDEGGI